MSPASSAPSATVSWPTRLAEVLAGGGRHAVGAVPEVDGVEVQLEDALLRVALLELPGERRLLRPCGRGSGRRSSSSVLHELLGDGRAALGDLALGGVDLHGPEDGPEVDAVVEPEPLVLDGDDGVARACRGSRSSVTLARFSSAWSGDDRRAVGGEDHRGLRPSAGSSASSSAQRRSEHAGATSSATATHGAAGAPLMPHHGRMASVAPGTAPCRAMHRRDGPARRPRGPWPDPRHAPTGTPSPPGWPRDRSPLYYGCDPTADSLHIGNLIGLLVLRRFADAGHRPIALAGGATGMVGDPGGRSEERNLLDEATLRANVAAIKAPDRPGPGRRRRLAARRQPTTGPATSPLLDFLRDVGKHVTVNQMVARESVKARMESEHGISYTEFSYMLLQANDYRWLHEHEGCELQIGGSDQWGNILSGVDLIRRGHRRAGPRPLLAAAHRARRHEARQDHRRPGSGSSPSAPRRTSFFQHWMGTDDRQVGEFLRQVHAAARRRDRRGRRRARRRRPEQRGWASAAWPGRSPRWSTAPRPPAAAEGATACSSAATLDDADAATLRGRSPPRCPPPTVPERRSSRPGRPGRAARRDRRRASRRARPAAARAGRRPVNGAGGRRATTVGGGRPAATAARCCSGGARPTTGSSRVAELTSPARIPVGCPSAPEAPVPATDRRSRGQPTGTNARLRARARSPAPAGAAHLDNGRDDGKASAGLAIADLRVGRRRACQFNALKTDNNENRCPFCASWCSPPGGRRLNTDLHRSSLRWLISMESLILAQDERWRRA